MIGKDRFRPTFINKAGLEDDRRELYEVDIAIGREKRKRKRYDRRRAQGDEEDEGDVKETSGWHLFRREKVRERYIGGGCATESSSLAL